MASVTEGPEVVGMKVAASFTAVVLGVLISEFLFAHLQTVFSKDNEAPTENRQGLGMFLLAMPFIGLFVLFLVLWILSV